MAFKRNLKLYVKDKATITALMFLLLFIIIFSISFIPSVINKKGIKDQFENYEISFVTTNNHNVVYAVCDDRLFYSQNKAHSSTLNDFAGIKDYSNQFSDMSAKLHNFVQINYTFPDEIIDVQGVSDNLVGAKGETVILTKNGDLYLISSRSKYVELLLKDVSKFQICQDNSNNTIYYLVQHQNNGLYIYYLENRILIKQLIYNEFVDNFFFINTIENKKNLLIQKNNELYNLSFESLKEYEDRIGYAYIIKENIATLNLSINNLNIKSQKIVGAYGEFYSLNNNNVYKITYNHDYQIEAIDCPKNVDDIYTTGVNACVAVCQKELYYFGDLKHFDSTNSFISLGIDDGLVFGSRNALIKYGKDKRLYMYNKDTSKYEAMYENIFTKYIMRYFALFAILMTLFYLVLSWCESNKRYNRYFNVNNEN